jgi:NHL repeat
MNLKKCLYLGGTVCGTVLAFVFATGIWQPLAKADGAGQSQGPSFAVDPSWPKPLPAPVGSDGAAHPWVTGEIGGNCTDKYDNVYTNNRGWEVGNDAGGPLQGNESGAINGQDSAAGIPSPPIVAYNTEGDVVFGFGNPTLFTTGSDYGYAAYMPQGAHGCFVDYQGYVWVAGNGDGIVQKYNPQAAAAEGPDGASATYVLQIGTKGDCDGAPTNSNPFSSCGEGHSFNSSHTMLNEPADIAVDPDVGPVSGTRGDIYIADGYGNHRVVVFNAAGQYVGQWGTACSTNGPSCPPGYFAATGGAHPHCVVLGNDGLVYVCDRNDSRIQVFSRNCAVRSTATTPQPVCLPVRIIDIDYFPTATAASKNAILLGGSRACDVDFWPNIDYLATQSPTKPKLLLNVDLSSDNVWLLNKVTGAVFGALGACGIAPCPGHNAGHFAFGHMVDVDSHGNVYVAETTTGRRIQKFVPVNGDQY